MIVNNQSSSFKLWSICYNYNGAKHTTTSTYTNKQHIDTIIKELNKEKKSNTIAFYASV